MSGARWKSGAFGVVFAFIGVLAGGDAMTKSGWRKAEAQVVDVSVSCHMKSEEKHIGYKTVSEADIPCDQQDVFRLVHSDKSWTTREDISGTLNVPGLNGDVASASMTLWRIDGRLPVVGDKFIVAQNPSNPAKVARTDAAGSSALIAAICGAVGAFLLWLAFGLKGGAKPKLGSMALSPAQAADDAERVRKADALIAAAVARNNSQPAYRPAQMSTPMRPQTAMVTPGAARSSFGKKR